MFRGGGAQAHSGESPHRAPEGAKSHAGDADQRGRPRGLGPNTPLQASKRAREAVDFASGFTPNPSAMERVFAKERERERITG